MPWKNQGGGNWQNSGGDGPWGTRPPGGGGGRGGGPGRGNHPDIEDGLRKVQEKMRDVFNKGGPGASKFALILAALVIFVLWLSTGIYRVQPEEKGVVLRFGKLVAITDSGLNYHLPYPIESVVKPQVERVNRIEVGIGAGGRSNNSDEGLILTGDENIVDVGYVVQWKIDTANVADYLFNINDPEQTVKAVAESVVRELIGQTPLIEVMTEGRTNLSELARQEIQTLLTEYGAGVTITGMQLQRAEAPSQVREAFLDVQKAQADRVRLQNEAEAYANDIIPRARGQAERLLQEAQAYEQEVVARAEGEAQRFSAILAEYEQARDVTRKRIYLETMEDVLADMNKIIMDEKSGQGVVPYLPLPALDGRQNRAGGQ